ncbi:MAG: hypothetical protein U1F67_18225 [Rubrivivax sp.]
MQAWLAQGDAREVRGLYAATPRGTPTIRLREAEVRRAEASAARRGRRGRRQPLLATGAVGAEGFQRTQAAWR